jgi:putative ABC transport system permease protein
VLAATTSTRRFNTALLTAFATIALLLALLGIYGTMAYAVAERNREIAVRMALGATREKVLRGTLAKALTIAALGTVVGLVLSGGLTRFVNSLLFEVKTFDAVAMGGAIVVLMVTSALAAWLPAKRAAAIEPMQLLRME